MWLQNSRTGDSAFLFVQNFRKQIINGANAMKTITVHNRHEKNSNFTASIRCSGLSRRENMYMVLNLLGIAFSYILWPLVILLGSFALMALPVTAAPFAYVANRDSDDVSVIDTLTNTVVGPSIPVGDTPVAVAIIHSTTPTSRDQCKKGGWKTFNNPTFRNQGQCASFVKHLNKQDHGHDHDEVL